MTNLRTQGQRLQRQLLDGPETPPWWPVLQIVLAAGFVIFLLVSLATDSGAPAPPGPLTVGAGPVAAPAQEPVAAPEPTAPVAPEPLPATDPSPAGPAATVSLPSMAGGTVTVERASFETAEAGAQALFTNDFSQVPLAQGTSAPVVPGLGVEFSVVQSSVDLVLDGEVRFVFTGAPADGSAPRTAFVTVVSEGGRWAFKGD
jgi:hypothetical protein